jgi:GNAT superfamily N-acetyltransferase
MINSTLAEAWHFDPIGEREADAMARLLRPILDPTIALLAEDDTGPCGVALAVPDVNWLWRKAGGRLWPLGWARLLRWYRSIPQARLMALGLEPRVHGSSLAARLIGQLHRAGLARGYVRGELSQVFDDNESMRRILDRMRLPVVRRYAVFTRDLQG